MKKVVLLLAAVLALTFTGIAQTSGGTAAGASGSTDQTTGTKAKKSKKTGSESGGATAASEEGKSAKHGAKGSQLTGCLAAGDSENAFKLTNGRYKKGVEVEPGTGTDLKAHVGHKVKLSGTWAKGGGAEGADKAKAGAKHFVASNVAHIADTCTAASSATGGEHKGKKKEGGKGAEAKTPGL